MNTKLAIGIVVTIIASVLLSFVFDRGATDVSSLENAVLKIAERVDSLGATPGGDFTQSITIQGPRLYGDEQFISTTATSSGILCGGYSPNATTTLTSGLFNITSKATNTLGYVFGKGVTIGSGQGLLATTTEIASTTATIGSGAMFDIFATGTAAGTAPSPTTTIQQHSLDRVFAPRTPWVLKMLGFGGGVVGRYASGTCDLLWMGTSRGT